MGGFGRGSLYLDGGSPVHRLTATAKLVAHLTFVIVVVSTPARMMWAFAVYAVLLAVVTWLAQVPVRILARRMVVETPFVLFALLLPFVATGERTVVLGMSLSLPGLVAGWNVLAKATLGVVASILLAATTDIRALLGALARLRVPAQVVEIATFMVRYLSVVQDDMHRMRIARESRGFEAQHLGHAAAVARGAGALFVRTYERGERVHLAMLSRGGGTTVAAQRSSGFGEVPAMAAAALPVAALIVLVAGRVLT